MGIIVRVTFGAPTGKGKKPCNGRNLPHPPWASRSDSRARLCSCFLRTYTGRADHLSEGWSSRRAQCPFFRGFQELRWGIFLPLPSGRFVCALSPILPLVCRAALSQTARATYLTAENSKLLPSSPTIAREVEQPTSSETAEGEGERGRAGSGRQARGGGCGDIRQAKPQPITIQPTQNHRYQDLSTLPCRACGVGSSKPPAAKFVAPTAHAL